MKDENILEGTDIVEKQIMSPISDSEEGSITKKELGEEETVDVIIELLNKDAKDAFSPKYQEELANMAKEDPTSVMIETPEGWMTIAESMKKGFNPESGEFDGETLEQRIDRIIKEEGLSPEEGARVKDMVMMKEEQPAEVPMGEEAEGAAVAEEMPIEGELPVEGEAPVEGTEAEAEAPAIDPALLAALGGGK